VNYDAVCLCCATLFGVYQWRVMFVFCYVFVRLSVCGHVHVARIDLVLPPLLTQLSWTLGVVLLAVANR